MLLQGRPMEAGPGNDLSQDILKILYAAEDERVEVSASGELTITAPNGEQVQGEVPVAGDDITPDNGEDIGGDDGDEQLADE